MESGRAEASASKRKDEASANKRRDEASAKAKTSTTTKA